MPIIYSYRHKYHTIRSDRCQRSQLLKTLVVVTSSIAQIHYSELASLTTNQIKRKKGGYIVLIRGKNDVDYRDAPLGREAYEHIQVWLSARPVQSEYVFTAFDGRGERAKDIRMAQKVLGHKRIETTARHYVLDELEPGLTDNLY